MTYVVALVVSVSFVLPSWGCTSDRDEREIADLKNGNARGTTGPRTSSSSQSELRRDSLATEGLYECCTKPDCLECADESLGCKCYSDLKKEDPICGECIDGYRAGKGRLKLVSIPGLKQRAKRERE